MAVRSATQPTFTMMLGAVPLDKPPLDYISIRIASFLGTNEATLRLPAFLFHLATVVATGCLGWLLTRDLRLSVVAAALQATDVMAFRHAQQVLPYSQLSLWLALCALGCVAWVYTNKLWFLLGAAGAGALASATAYTAPFFLLPVFGATLGVVLRRAETSAVASLFAIGGVVLVSMLPFLAGLSRLREAAAVPAPWGFQDWPGIAMVIARTIGAEPPVGSSFVVIAATEILLFVAGLVALALPSRRLAAVLLPSFLVGGLLLTLGALRASNHWVDPRYLLPLSVPRSVVLAMGFMWLVDWGGIWRLAAFLLAAGLLVVRPVSIHRNAMSFPDYRATIASIDKAGSTGDAIVLVDNPVTVFCISHYDPRMNLVAYDAGSAAQREQLRSSAEVIIVPPFNTGWAVAAPFEKASSIGVRALAPGEISELYE